MFKIIESNTRDPIRLPVKPGIRLSPGHVVKVIDYQGDIVIDICSGNNALGLVKNRCTGGTKVNYLLKAFVYPQRMILNIDKFDRKNPIKAGDSLYCDECGMLSSVKLFENSFVLAKVIEPLTKEKKHIQILWL